MSECFKCSRWVAAVIVLSMLAVGCGPAGKPHDVAGVATLTETEPVYDIPYLPNVTVDGKDDDWAGGGYRVDLLTAIDGSVRAPDDHSARIRLAWCDKGLLMLAYVQDDRFVEGRALEDLWKGDAIEVYLAPKKGDKECVQWCISPGMTEDHPDIRWSFHDGRTAATKDYKVTGFVAARSNVGNGYVCEALLPFESVGIQAKRGNEIGFQVWVDDVDPGKDPYYASWYPGLGTIGARTNMYRVRLADKPSDPMIARCAGSYDWGTMDANFNIVSLKEQAGKAVTVMSEGKPLCSGRLAADQAGRSQCRLATPIPVWGQSWGRLSVNVDGKEFQTLTMENPDAARASIVVFTDLVARPSVFSGVLLPKVDFEVPLYGRALLGRYELKTTFYDKDYNVVTKADKPGRYGAVTEIKLADGRVIRRFNTLFKMPNDVRWRRVSTTGSLEWPTQTGITADMTAKNQRWLNEFYKWTIVDSTEHNDYLAVAMAGLYETTANQQTNSFYLNPEQRDRQWWVGLKHKLYGYDKIFPKPFDRPVKVQGPPARVLREGSLQQAGMKPDAAKNLDAVLKQWAGDTDEAFAVCVARHGVIVLHKAYGMRDGKPMTVDTTSEMASATKMMSGAMMLTMVDQGMISLDDEAAKYLPTLRGIKTNRPLTIRHLYTHTSGIELMAHWGAEMNDMEERFATLMPTLKVGQASMYNGTGMELSCKILEAASGQSLPEFYRTRLLQPLGCTPVSHFHRATWDTQATPLEVAKILQMILNKGAYGQYRWFSEETYKQLLPVDQEAKTGVKAIYGMGSTWMDDGGLLSKEAFGHGAASSATIRVDPTLDLVIVMTRNSAGTNYGKYHQKFIEAIVNGIADTPKKQAK